MDTTSKTRLDLWMGDSFDDNWLAQVIGCTRSQASRIRRAKSCPSLAAAVAVEKATGGQVRAADLLADSSTSVDTSPQEQAVSTLTPVINEGAAQ